jgi:hypothetical protein
MSIDGRSMCHDIDIISAQIVVGETGTVENTAGKKRAESRTSFRPCLLPHGFFDAATGDCIEISTAQLFQEPAAEN